MLDVGEAIAVSIATRIDKCPNTGHPRAHVLTLPDCHPHIAETEVAAMKAAMVEAASVIIALAADKIRLPREQKYVANAMTIHREADVKGEVVYNITTDLSNDDVPDA